AEALVLDVLASDDQDRLRRLDVDLADARTSDLDAVKGRGGSALGGVLRQRRQRGGQCGAGDQGRADGVPQQTCLHESLQKSCVGDVQTVKASLKSRLADIRDGAPAPGARPVASACPKSPSCRNRAAGNR